MHLEVRFSDGSSVGLAGDNVPLDRVMKIIRKLRLRQTKKYAALLGEPVIKVVGWSIQWHRSRTS
jgi:hypothetical protein